MWQWEISQCFHLLRGLPPTHHIVLKSSSAWPPRGSLTPQPLQRGMGKQASVHVCVCVCVCVHMCVCLGKRLLTFINILLHLMCIVPTYHSSSFIYLFVCFGWVYYCYFIPSRPQRGGGRILLLFPAMQTTLHLLSANTHSPGGLVNVNANTNQQTKTKEHNMDPSKGQSHYTFSVCPLFCLELPLGHIMTASHFSLKGPHRLPPLAVKVQLETELVAQKIQEFCSKSVRKKVAIVKKDSDPVVISLCLTCAASSKNPKPPTPTTHTHTHTSLAGLL